MCVLSVNWFCVADTTVVPLTVSVALWFWLSIVNSMWYQVFDCGFDPLVCVEYVELKDVPMDSAHFCEPSTATCMFLGL